MADSQSSRSYLETLDFFKSYIRPIKDSLLISIANAEGYICAQDIVCPQNIPSFDNSAMDGWAFSSNDILPEGFTLTEVGSSFAGHPYEKPLEKGQCVRIMTGGEVPTNADTVVKQEIVTANEKQITFPDGVKAGDNVRKKGAEFKEGEVCIKAGTKLHAPHVNFLATVGIRLVSVLRKPKVAFFSTGDELRPLGTELKKGQIYDSNRYSIGAMLRESGFDSVDLGIVEDDPVKLEEKLLSVCDKVDAVITLGGVSVGEADFTRKVVEKNGELVPWHCNIKPGRPLAIGKIKNAYFFGLPGNPTATQITYYTVVAHALKILSGLTDLTFTASTAKAGCNIKKRTGYTEFQRGILSYSEKDGPVVITAGSQKTGAIGSMFRANCFIYLCEDRDSVNCGENVPVIPLWGFCS